MVIRHNAVRDLVFNLAQNASLGPVLEKYGCLGDCPGMRPADVYLPTILSGRPAAMDVAVIDPLQDNYVSKRVRAVEDYAENVKYHKYDEGFRDSKITFVPCVVDVFNGWCVEGQDLLADIIRRGADRLSLPRTSYIIQSWQRLAISVQRSCAKMTLSKIPVMDY